MCPPHWRLLPAERHSGTRAGRKSVHQDRRHHPLMKGMPSKARAVNENSVFDLDAPDMAMFEKFSEKMKETIQGSREWRARSPSGRPYRDFSAACAFGLRGHGR